MARIGLIMTGASGSAYGMRLSEQLVTLGHELVFCATEEGRRTCARELGFELPLGSAEAAAIALATFLDLPGADGLRVAYPDSSTRDVVSDTYPPDAVIVAPASMGFCASIATGLTSDLPERLCDMALRDRRPLVVVPRATPLSLVHLRNLTSLTEVGAIVVPAMPAFHAKPESVDDLISFVAGKVLDVLGIEHSLSKRGI